jgi:hypothetical protein
MKARLAALLAMPPIVWTLGRWDILPHVTLCLFQRVTGRPCPGCGMTRSMLRLSQGDVVESLRLHPLGLVLAGLWFATLAGTAVGLARGGDPVARFLDRRGAGVVVSLIVLFVASWLLRAFVFPAWAPDPVR